MIKITNERLAEIDKELSLITPAFSLGENGINLINTFTLECSDYELACFIIHKLMFIEEKAKEEYDIKDKERQQRYIANRKIKFLSELNNKVKHEQCILFKIIRDCDLIQGDFVLNEDYVEVFSSCIKLKENTELNIKLQNKLPNKEVIINKGKI